MKIASSLSTITIILALCLLILAPTTQAAHPSGIGLVPHMSGFSTPISMNFLPDGRQLVSELNGKVKIVRSNGSLQPELAIDLADPQFQCKHLGVPTNLRALVSGEAGLLSSVADPEFLTNQRVYFYYVANSLSMGGITLLVRMNFDSTINPLQLDPASCEVIMLFKSPGGVHFGGTLLFTPDGTLFLSTGDNGRPCDPRIAFSEAPVTGDPCRDNSTDLAPLINRDSGHLRGKILRINVNETTPAGHGLCGVPSNQPALYSANTNDYGPTDKCDEIYASGLRNPWRMSIDRQTGDLIIGDVGQDWAEEVDVIAGARDVATPPGAFLGWPCYESMRPNSLPSPACNLRPATFPVMDLSQLVLSPSSRSVIGGYRYRGPVTAFNGFYIAHELYSKSFIIAQPGVIRPWQQPQPTWNFEIRKTERLMPGTPNLLFAPSFAEDRIGQLYLLDFDTIYKLTFNADVIFRDGFVETRINPVN